MGFLINLPKTSNRMYMDFEKAYWYLDNIRVIYDDNDIQKVLYDVTAYPSREIRDNEGLWLAPAYPFGQPTSSRVDSCLYSFTDIHAVSEIFPDGIPYDKVQVKKILYEHFKQYLDSLGIEYTDVLEETQS